MNIIVISVSNGFVGFYADQPTIRAHGITLEELLIELGRLRDVYEECCYEIELEDLLESYKIVLNDHEE